MVVGIGLGVLAAIGYGLSSVMQTMGARQATAEADGSNALTTTSGHPTLKSTIAAALTGVFVLGAIMDVLGFAAGAGAARMLPLFLSQTIVAGNLVVTAVLGTTVLGIHLHTRDWAAIGLVLLALCMLGTAAHAGGTTHVSLPFRTGLLIATVGVVAISLLTVRRLGKGGSVAAGAAAGVLFGAIAIAVRVLDGVSPFSLSHLIVDPAAWTIAIAGAFGFYLHTVALQLGAVNGSTAAMVVGETALPGIVGVVLLGDSTVAGREWLGVTGFGLAVVGAVLVALFGSGEAQRSAEQNEVHLPPVALHKPHVLPQRSEHDADSHRDVGHVATGPRSFVDSDC
ncbi:hypothetical protein [Williamsia sterculiae]|uniref:Integral membrane protein n=1 Tax=Williamsia sterculiae TaxID=1344003 RepID=A0A1N7DHP5_9NOCA|nr:hypothetical protein [Williamsia sterculiae]SIR75287.1 hypothetical protein SAMN05445060_0639 [Williamsia sterculiae]